MKLKKHYKCVMAIAMSIAMLAGNLWLTGDMPYVEAAEPEELVCEHHVHDEECGYNEETKEGCTYECPECAKEDDNIIEEQEEQKKEEEQVKEEEQKSSEVEVAPMAVNADESTGTENTKESDVAVTVTVSGATTSYSSLQEAVDASEAMDGTTRRTIKLMADADITTTGLSFMKSTTLDLNGYEIKAANTDAGNIKIGNSFTLNDSSENKTGRIYSVTTEKTDVSLIETGGGNIKTILFNSGQIDTASAGAGNDAILVTTKTKLKIAGDCAVNASGNAIVTRQDATDGSIYVNNNGVVTSETGYGIYYAGTTSNGSSVYLYANAVVYGKLAGIAMENGSLITSGFTGVVTSKKQDSNGKWGYGSGDAASPAIYLNGQLGKVKATLSSNGTFIGGNEAIKVKADNNDVTVAISNGQYSSPVKPEWCADGYVQGTRDEETKLYGVEIIKRVVNTNTGKFYNNTSTAVSEAQNGETIQLLDNCTYSGVITIDKSITLDLNSFTLTSTSQSQQSGEYPAVMIGKYNTIVDVVIKNGTIKNTNPITFEDVKVEAGTGPVIEISGGAATFTECDFKVTDTTSPSDFSRAAVAVSYEGTAVINSGTYTSSGYGVYVYSSGGKITVKEGSSVTGAVAAVKADVDSSTYLGAESIIEIQGGSIQGEMLTNNNDAASIIVSGGVFDTEVPDEYCAEGFMPAVYDAATGKYTVAAAVAEIVSGSSVQRFTSLGDALKAAQEGDTVRIVKNTEIKKGEKLTIKEGISVEVLAGANLTNNGEITVKGTLKINKGGSVTDGDNGIIDIYGTVDNDGNALDESGVKYHIKSLKFEQSEINLVIGEKIQLKVKKTPVNAVEDIEYSVDAKDVISIDKYGNVTAIGVGKATITAKSGDVETTCTIEVTKKPESSKPDDSTIDKNGGSDKPNSGKSSAQSKDSEKKTIKTAKKTDTVKTADTANIYLWGLIAIGALLVAAEAILIKRRLRYRNR